jgi:hypothetical protein
LSFDTWPQAGQVWLVCGDVNFLNFGFRLFPIIAELFFTTHATLIACKSLLVRLEAIQWGNIVAVTQRSESGDSDIDAKG